MTSAAAGLFHVVLDVGGTAVAGAHRLPGQYVQLSMAGAGESHFALASPPARGGKELELLIKSGTPLSDALIFSPPGTAVRTTLPSGRGFPLDLARGRDLLLFATGSGISPIRSCVEALRQERSSYGQVRLFFGVRTPDAFAYGAELQAWRGDDIEVTQVVSQPGATGWAGLTGYVQEHVGALPVKGAVAFLCGQKAMVQGVTDMLTARGLSKERIFQNF